MDINKTMKDKYMSVITKYAYDKSDVDDIFQDSMEKMIRRKRKNKEIDTLYSYFKNETKKHYKKREVKEFRGLTSVKGYDPVAHKRREPKFNYEQIFNDLEIDLSYKHILDKCYKDLIHMYWTNRKINFELAFYCFILHRVVGYSRPEIKIIFDLSHRTIERYAELIQSTFNIAIESNFNTSEIKSRREISEVKAFIRSEGFRNE